MMRLWITRSLLAVTVIVLLACVPPAPSKDDAKEVTAISEFDVGYRPMQSARELPQLMLATGGAAAPAAQNQYSDITFFPVVRADALEAMSSGPRHLRRRDVAPDLGGIDFVNNFAFLVAHPDGVSSHSALSRGEYATYLSSLKVSYPEGRIVIDLSAGRLGGLDPLTALTARWKGKIYPLERRGRDRLEVRLYDDIYVYSLKDSAQALVE